MRNVQTQALPVSPSLYLNKKCLQKTLTSAGCKPRLAEFRAQLTGRALSRKKLAFSVHARLAQNHCAPLIREDPSLRPYTDALNHRFDRYLELKHQIEGDCGSLSEFALGYERFGLHHRDGGVEYVEWAPRASSLSLMGEFNNWEPSQYPGTCDDFGVWRVFIPDQEDGTPTVPHMSQVRVSMETPEGRVDRVPTWAQYVERCEGTDYHNGVFYNPPENERYQWQHDKPNRKRSLRIYEAHVGMSSEDHGVATYNHFTDNVLPRIKEGGYNAIQLMAVQEHALYSSFGYQVTSFFAASSRSGTPEDLKRLVDTAHGLGLTVLLDVVHAHASSNTMDGLNLFDTSTGLYFRDGPSGYHDLWGTRMFDYGNYEVMRFLLSNLRWYPSFPPLPRTADQSCPVLPSPAQSCL
ncbi:hypothetical protein CYMTET_33576, partial [Cymbomonas tetramitiformis]